jgi:hypothetical protein
MPWIDNIGKVIDYTLKNAWNKNSEITREVAKDFFDDNS